MRLVGQSFWLALAVALAGIVHMVVVKKDLFARLKVPIDGGRTFRGKPLFGPNKTWRGFAFMVVATALLGAVQGALGGEWAARAGAEPLDFAAVGARFGVPSAAAGYGIVNAVLGLGYALGELPNSFVKRRIDIVPGKVGAGLLGAVFFLVDQADSVVAALVLGALLFPLPWVVVLVGTVCLTGLHLFINGSLYLVKVRKNL